MREALERAVHDARALEEGGFDAAIVENFGDAPFYKDDVPKAIGRRTRPRLRGGAARDDAFRSA